MTDSSTAIAVAPIVAALQPLVISAVSAAVAGIVGIGVSVYNSWKWRGSTIDAAHTKLIQDAAANEAAKIVAGADTAVFGNARITVASPAVLAAADAILGANDKNLKSALDATGVTEDLVASLVTGELGKLQAKIVGGSPVLTAGEVKIAPALVAPPVAAGPIAAGPAA